MAGHGLGTKREQHAKVIAAVHQPDQHGRTAESGIRGQAPVRIEIVVGTRRILHLLVNRREKAPAALEEVDLSV